MALPVGSKAPDFTLSTKSSDGFELVTLSDQLTKDKVLLLFFPMAFTSVCTSEMCSVSDSIQRYDSLKSLVYGISGDSPFALEEWAKKESIKMPLLSDYDHSVARLYDVAYESFLPGKLPLSGVAKRSAFVIDHNGIIQYAESSDNPKQVPNFDAIREKLEELG